MDIDLLIEAFIQVKPKEYEKDIRIFIEYIESIKMPVAKEVLQGMRTKNILDSIDFYIKERGINSVSPVKRYVSAIAEFFKFIIGNGDIDNKEFYNEILLPTIVPKSYWGRVNEKIAKDSRLREKDIFDILERSEVTSLIENCNTTMAAYCDNADIKKNYNKVLAALSIKLIALTGIVYRDIRTIKMSSEIIDYNTLNINGFRFYLPITFSKQLKDYLKLRKDILTRYEIDQEYLFITFKGEQLPVQTHLISSFLGTCTGRKDLNGLIKYAIKEMILAGVNDSVIGKFTGAGPDLISQCINEVDVPSGSLNWNRYLDSKLRSIDTFDLL